MLNTIPDDCIMEIFSYLGEWVVIHFYQIYWRMYFRMDLNEMICVSHQMLYFGQLQLKKVNRYGTLRIVEVSFFVKKLLSWYFHSNQSMCLSTLLLSEWVRSCIYIEEWQLSPLLFYTYWFKLLFARKKVYHKRWYE